MLLGPTPIHLTAGFYRTTHPEQLGVMNRTCPFWPNCITSSKHQKQEYVMICNASRIRRMHTVVSAQILSCTDWHPLFSANHFKEAQVVDIKSDWLFLESLKVLLFFTGILKASSWLKYYSWSENIILVFQERSILPLVCEAAGFARSCKNKLFLTSPYWRLLAIDLVIFLDFYACTMCKTLHS